ncbi:NmrA-like family protein [Ophiobolus disseminans]|uniref:NmrA-like family protein n=1 Tax=Ophiobolus disseminans TaxID=1469910 RepID=A0A6A6ZY61_9PLEO|nr:NmrA-like family protein [Ophiobolus disseminans]
MVRIAIAGGAGNVASEIIDALVATKKHEIVILTRRDPPSTATSGVTYAKTSYEGVNELADIFKNVHTVLSFLAPFDQEKGIEAQKKVIDASVQAGVKRFAPSEWIGAGIDHMSWYTFKGAARTYLAELNASSKVLEYCLFQPGFFTDYLSSPYRLAKHVKAIETPWDFERRRMLLPEGADDAVMVFTTVQDLANVVARAVEYEGVWPVDGGITGSRLTVKQLVALGEKLRGRTFDVSTFSAESLEAGTWEPKWLPRIDHPSLPIEQIEAMSKVITAGLLLALKANAFDVSDGWNKLLPDYKFEDAETFLAEVWKGKS